MIIKSFIVNYIGDNPPTKGLIEESLIDGQLDDGGLLEVEEIESTLVICQACDGIGNCDEAAGFNLDCSVCGGSGWLKRKDKKK